MEKTSVYLRPEERERLSRLARESGKSQATIIREAIAGYEPWPAAGRDLALFGSGHGDGRSVADLPDEELLEGFRG